MQSIVENEHLSVESLYLYADNVFGYENWLHEIKKLKINLSKL